MNLVDDDIPQVLKEFNPFGVMRQDAGMKHVRVGDDDMTRLTHGPAGCGRRIPVVRIGFYVDAHRLNEFI